MWLIYDARASWENLNNIWCYYIYISSVVNYSKYNNGMLASQFCLNGLPVVLQGDKEQQGSPHPPSDRMYIFSGM
jgi:hypothetical protein